MAAQTINIVIIFKLLNPLRINNKSTPKAKNRESLKFFINRLIVKETAKENDRKKYPNCSKVASTKLFG